MELWQLWLLFVVPEIAGFINILSVALVFVGTFVLIFFNILLRIEQAKTHPDKQDVCTTKAFLKFMIRLYIGLCVLATLSSLVPTKDDAIKIVGGYYITNIENIDNLPPNAVKAANKFIEEYLEDNE